MRLLRQCFCALLILTGSLLGQIRANKVDGKLARGTYENSVIGLSYHLPDGFFEVAEDGNLGPARLLLVADRHTGTAIKERLLLAVDQRKNYKYGSSVYTSRFAHSVAQQNGVNIIREGEEQFGGHRFSIVQYSQSDSGGVLYKTFACTETGEQFVMWVFASSSRERAAILLTSLENVSFKKD